MSRPIAFPRFPDFALLFCLGSISLAGCDDGTLDLVACTEEFVSGLQLEVREANTNTPAANGAVATIRDGDYVETATSSLNDPGAVFIAGAGERPGTYGIEVAREGFVTWDTTGVVVDSDFCHVIPVQIQVRLTLSP